MPQSEQIIAVDIGGTEIKSAILTNDGEILYHKCVKTLPHRETEHILRALDDIIRECENAAIQSYYAIKGVGIVMPGYPDSNGRVPFIPNISSLTNIPIKKFLMQKRTSPILFENDGNAAAYGEYIFGQKKKYLNLVVLTLGTGIGSGVIMDGKIMRGRENISGELGHITVNSNGPRCPCGKKGCLESYFSGYALMRLARELVKKNKDSSLAKYDIEGLDLKSIAEEAKKGDRLSKYIFEYSGKWLGVGISILLNSFNPDKVILGGGLSKAHSLFVAPMMKEIGKHIHAQFSDDITVEFSQFSSNLGILGAASLFVD